MRILPPVETSISCPLSLNCAEMGLKNNYCVNHSVCLHALEPNAEIDVDAIELCEDNPNVFWTCYWVANKSWNVKTPDPVSGWFWMVKLEPPHRGPLAAGYAKAVPVDLPVVVNPGCMIVVANRDVLGEDGKMVGSYAKAERNPSFWLELNGSPITLIEWLDVSDPTSIRMIHTTDEQFHCDVQKDGTLLVESDECGGDSVQNDYWIAPGYEMPSTYGDRVRPVELPVTETLKTLIESTVFVDKILYCRICQQNTYEDRYGVSECGHLRYVEHLSDWGGCGYEEEDLSSDYAEAFQSLAQRLNTEPSRSSDTVETLSRYLQDRNLQEIWWLTDRYQYHEDLEPAVKYLDSLTEGIPQSCFDQAIEWLRQAKNNKQHSDTKTAIAMLSPYWSVLQ